MPFKDLPAPSSVAEALKQRMDIYKQAAEGAKGKGDDRKARMHQRIVKVATCRLSKGNLFHFSLCDKDFFMLTETKSKKPLSTLCLIYITFVIVLFFY